MARFYVGQRVRIVYTKNPNLTYLVGREGKIMAACDVYSGNWDVDVDGNGSVSADGIPYSFKPHHLEPITDSNDLVSWESMRDLWVPEHLREDA